MQHTAIFEEQVALTPRDMKNDIESIDDLLLEKLKAKLEGKCSRHGFVLPDKLKVLSRSMGALEKGRFTGSILYHIQAEGDVLNPPDGAILTGRVIRKNKMGVYVSYQDAIRVIVPRDLHIGNKDFEDIQVDQEIKVEVKKSRFQVNDPFILSVGVYLETVGGAAAATAVAPTTSEEGEGGEDNIGWSENLDGEAEEGDIAAIDEEGQEEGEEEGVQEELEDVD